MAGGASGSAWVEKEIRGLLRAGTSAGMSDGQLLSRFAESRDHASEAAFSAIVDRHGGLVLRACRAILSDPHDADDAAQAVFLILARRAGAIRQADALGSWLFGTSLRVAKKMRDDAIRRRRREQRGAERSASLRAATTDPASQADDHAKLYEELARLPERYRRPLVLCHLEGLTHQEAADRLGCPAKTVHTRLTRGKARLRDRLIRLGFAPSAVLLATTVARAGPPPAPWAESTARSAIEFAAGKMTATTAGTLAQGVLTAMIATKLKVALVGAIACAVLLGIMPMALKPRAATTPEPIALAPIPDDPQAKKPESKGPSRSAEITILDAETGKPIEGATVKVGYDFKHFVSKTGPDGKVNADLTKKRLAGGVNADVWADGYVQQRTSYEDVTKQIGNEVQRYEFRLHKGDQTFGGTVKDESGKPIVGAEVALWGYLGELKDKKELTYMVTATTDDQGRWRISNLRKMRWAYLYLTHTDYLSDDAYHPRKFGEPRGTDDPKLLEPLRDFSDVQVMQRGVAIAGRVTDEAGKPIGGAEITWVGEDHLGTLGHELTWVPSEADGRFTIRNARPGGVVLVAKAKGHAPDMIRVKATEGVKDAALHLKPAKALAGRVVDAKGEPIEGAYVIVDTWRGFRGLGVYLNTDRDGRFRWDEAPDEGVLINVNDQGRLSIIQRPTKPGDDPVFTLLKTMTVTGDVRDIITKARVQEGELEVGILDPETNQVEWGTGNGSILQGHLQATLGAEEPRVYQLRIKSRGYATFVSRSIKSDEGDVKIDALLTPPEGRPLEGTVLGVDGKPLAGAEVALAGPDREGVYLTDGKPVDAGASRWVKTNAEGRFLIPPSARLDSPYQAVVVVHESGYAEVNLANFEESSKVALKPWGRIEGVYKVGDRPLVDREITYYFNRLGDPDVPGVDGKGKARTDSEGRFKFDRVAPGDVRVAPEYRANPEFAGWSNGTLVQVESGRMVFAPVGGTGRAIVARVIPPEGFDPKADYSKHSEYEIESDRPSIPYPEELRKARDGRIIGWGKRWWVTPEGRAYRREWVRRGQIQLGPEGAIRVDDLPPGAYRLKLSYSADPIYGRGVDASRVAFATRQFVIPEIPGGRSDVPLDLGVIRPGPHRSLKVGDVAPAFEVVGLDGKPITLGDFKGKVVLVDFWASWCGPCVAEVPALKAVRARFKGDDRFVMIGLSLDAEADAPRGFVSDQGIDWPQGHLGDWSKTDVPDRWAVESIPSTFLVGPDGKIVGTGLKGDAIADAVARALEQIAR